MRKLGPECSFINVIPDYIMERCETITLNRREILFLEGGIADFVYLVLSGRIGIHNAIDNGDTERVVWVFPGELVGEMEVLVGIETYSFSGYVYEDHTEVIKIAKEIFMGWLHTDNQTCVAVAQVLAKKMFSTSGSFCERTSTDGMGLVCDFILEIAKNGVKLSESYLLKYSRLEIAECCGISVRTVNRCVKKLNEQNLVTIVKGKIALTIRQYDDISKMIKEEEWKR
ncbi:Crp/Fnr family transcriptional regulator [Clostridia bacterium]|nr:Crp/Fnr family transcriptional regulator [Clostridia bacterium]